MKRLIALIILFAAPVAADHELLERDITHGADLYKTRCASCHGANLVGQPNWQQQNDDGTLPPPQHDETGHSWHHDNELLFNDTKFGGAEALAQRGVTGFNSGMPIVDSDLIW